MDIPSSQPSRQLLLRCSTTYIPVGIPEGEGANVTLLTAGSISTEYFADCCDYRRLSVAGYSQTVSASQKKC
jgi:hypothetical protein